MTPSMKENVRKCKLAGLRTASPAARRRPCPVEKKLIGGAAILGAGRPPHVAADGVTPPPGAKKPKPDHTAARHSVDDLGGVRHGATLDNIAVVDDNLRANLRYLVASPWRPPARVYGKKMTFTDRSVAQHRLLMSCKGWHSTHRGGDEPFPFEELLTPAEKAAADGDEGLRVQAYDRAGRDYDLKCKFLNCNDAYRLILEWSKFLKENHLDVNDKNAAMANEAMIDLWAFRSRWLSHGVDGHEDGRLGLVMVHYFRGNAPHADAAMDVHDALMQARKAKLKKNKEETGLSSLSSSKVKKNKEENGSSSSSSGEALAVVGALAEEKNGDAVDEEADVQGGAPAAVKMEAGSEERLAWAANGMVLLGYRGSRMQGRP
uniref:Uncharacterized protein n=1 Tax=Oryza meridionalis TaxID=40149 RepID=A0A0E0DNN5_9ORYZ